MALINKTFIRFLFSTSRLLGLADLPVVSDLLCTCPVCGAAVEVTDHCNLQQDWKRHKLVSYKQKLTSTKSTKNVHSIEIHWMQRPSLPQCGSGKTTWESMGEGRSGFSSYSGQITPVHLIQVTCNQISNSLRHVLLNLYLMWRILKLSPI